ncbi:hypothetical protein MJL33_32760, partial [Salmonella enterica subsp. enterica serovar Kentucky]|nr:hypothetical protein [Salmonella enterica subsp. enterica serovar Kentucky]
MVALSDHINTMPGTPMVGPNDDRYGDRFFSLANAYDADYPVSKVVCVGSNYANHIKEMGSATPEEPVLFIKPETALCDIRQ